MSRTRKGGKYKGGSMASAFKHGIAMKSPIYQTQTAEEQAQQLLGQSAPEAEPTQEMPQSTIKNLTPEDVVPFKERGVGSSAREDWLRRSKEKGEEEREAKRLKEEAEAEKERLLEEYTAKGYTDDYEEGMEKYEIRQESKENKREIKDDYKATKSDLKAKKKSGELSKKDYKSQKKAAKKAKKDAKKKNKQDKKKAKANRKRK